MFSSFSSFCHSGLACPTEAYFERRRNSESILLGKEISTPPNLPSERGGSFSPSLRGSERGSSSAFTLIELLIVIAIIAILSIVVVLTLSPAEMLRQARDQNRLSDMDTLTHALSLYQTDKATQGGILSLGNASTVYVSLPDPSLSGIATSTCASLGLPVLPMGSLYQCSSRESFRKTDGTGWLPLNLAVMTTGNPLGSLPVDPQNSSSSRLYYTYVTNGTNYELTASLESSKYKLGGSNDVVSQDGGTLASVYEKGSKLGLEPLDYGDPNLVGYWTFDEGSGSTVYDYSGSNATGSWAGTGTHWVAGKVGSGAGQFATTTGDYVSVPSNTSQNVGLSDFSISFWFKNTTPLGSGFWNIISKKNTMNLANPGWMFWFRNQGAEGHGFSLRINAGSGNDSIQGSVTDVTPQIADGSWHFVVASVSRSAETGNFYLDGASVGGSSPGSYPSGSYSTTDSLGIGATGAGAIGPPPGFNIDDVHIYNRALSASEIAALYNGGK